MGASYLGKVRSRAPQMKKALDSLVEAAACDANLLLCGETGVGKELLAETAHREGSRHARPFLVFDCAEKSPEATALELFGDETTSGAAEEGLMPGFFELANGGTLVLDHVDALAPHLQSALSRALNKRHVLRVHGSRAIPFDLRLMAITSENLALAVQRGQFREELYANLTEFVVTVPPLRRRVIDLNELVEDLLAEHSPARSLRDVPDRIWPALRTYPWPGNIRELKNFLVRGLMIPERWLLSTRTRDPSKK